MDQTMFDEPHDEPNPEGMPPKSALTASRSLA